MNNDKSLNIISDRKSLIIFLFFISIIFSFLSIRNHDQFQTFAWDLGFFDQIIWKASRFQYDYSTIGKINLLGDHFQPVLYLLVPLYWLWSDVKVILIAQAFLVVFAAYPLFLLCQYKLKNRFLAWSVIIGYLLFSGTQFTITNEFHQSAFIPLFLSMLLLYYEKNNNIGLIFAALGLICTREEIGFLLAALGLMMTFQKKIKRGIFLFLIGVTFSFIAIYFLIPIFSSQGQYIHFNYGEAGRTPVDVLLTFFFKPLTFLKLLTSPFIKLKTVFFSLASFGFLPLLSPISLIPVLQQFIIRFIDTNTIHRWLNLNHYSAPLGPLLAYASICGINNLPVCYRKKKLILNGLAAYLLFFSLFINWQKHGPINSLFKPQLYQDQIWVKNTNLVLKQVPADVSITAQNSLVPHLSQRKFIYLLPEINDADYIVVDLADGPNKYSPLNFEQIKELINNLIISKKYQLIFQRGETLLLKKYE